MDSITEAYNRMYLTEAFNLWQIIKQSPKAAAAWPEYEKYRQQGMSNAEALQKSGLKSALAIGASVAGSYTGGKLGGLLGPKGAAAGSLIGGTIPAIELPNWIDDMYQQRSKTGRYDPEVAKKRATSNRENSGIFYDEKSGQYRYDPSKRNRDAIDDEDLANFNDTELKQYAAQLSGRELVDIDPDDLVRKPGQGGAPKPGMFGYELPRTSGYVETEKGRRFYNANDGLYYGSDKEARAADKENATVARGGERVVAPKNGVPGTMIPGQPDSWKELGKGLHAQQDLQNYYDQGGILTRAPEQKPDGQKPETKPQVGRNWQNPYGQQSDKPSEGNFRDQFPQGNSELDDILNEPYTADQNIPDNKPGDVLGPDGKPLKPGTDNEEKPEEKPEEQKPQGMIPGKQNADGSNMTQTGKNNKGLTPMQQWATNYPALAAKVKPGQAGYDEIQAMKKPQGGATQSSVQQRAQQLQRLRTGKDETPVATASSLYQKPEEKLGNANNPMATPRPGGLMSKLQDYQNEHGYGEKKASAQQTDTSRFSRAPQQPQQARPMPQYGSPGMSNTERQARRGAEAVVDTVTNTVKGTGDALQGTGNALKRVAGSQPVQKVKDAAADVGRSAAVQTVKNQGQKALGALNNKRKEWTKPLGEQ